MNVIHPIRGARFRPVDSDDTLAVTEQRMRAAHATHMGYPYNLAFRPTISPFVSSTRRGRMRLDSGTGPARSRPRAPSSTVSGVTSD